MTTYHDIKLTRGLTWAGIAIGHGVAITTGWVNVNTDDGSVLSALAFMLMLSIPSTLAVLALDRRPSLMTAATMSSVLTGILLLTSLIGLGYLVMAILWYLAGMRRPRTPVAPVWASWARPLLAAATILPLIVMMIHADPRCMISDGDGNVIVSSDTQFPNGWRWSLGASGTTTSDGEGSTSCTSDTTQPWEALASMAVTSGVVFTAARWPTAESLGRDHERRQIV